MDPDKPMVSIVLPTYNGDKYLFDSISSCLEQTYENLELIVIDDCSSMDINGVLEKFSDSRLRYHRHEINLGLPSALNTGFSLARGDMLTWTSDDNLYHPTALAQLVEFLEQHCEIAFVYADSWLIDETGAITSEFVVGEPEMLHIQPLNYIGACFLYRREVMESIGNYGSDMRLVEDYEYWLRIAEQFQIAAYHTKLYYYRHHSTSLTGMSQPNQATRLALRVRQQRGWSQPGEYRRWTGILDKDEAIAAYLVGKRGIAFRKTISALWHNPRLLKDMKLLEILIGENSISILRAMLRYISRNPR